MATKITDANHSDSLQGSPEKRIDIGPDGILWTLVVTSGSNGKAKFFRSTNGGSTWAYAQNSDIDLEQTTAVPSFFIDADGFAHVSWVKWNKNPQVVRYARGTPTGTGTSSRGWSWRTLTISPANGRTGVDSDVVAFRSGTGWKAWVSYDMRPSAGAKVAQISISSSGSLSVQSTQHGPPTGGQANQYGSLEFNHTGDGVTPASTPHLFYVTAVQGTSAAIRANRASYSGGSWTWDSPVTISTAQVDRTTMATVWDGARLMIAWAPNAGGISVTEWDGAATTTARNPPALPGGLGAVSAVSLAHDPVTDDIYLAFHDTSDGDVRWSKFTRGTLSWSAWAVAAARTGNNSDGKVQLVRHPKRDAVDMMFATGSGTAWTVWSQVLANLVRTPAAPTLLSPASGSRADLAAGVTFKWQYNPVSPGDTQQAWAFRRTYSSTTEYWNAAGQAWSSSIVWNPGSAQQAAFNASFWTSGTTYTWSVRTRSSTGADSAWGADRTIVATTAPVVAVTDPLGVHYGESTPLVVWTYTSTDPQRDYEIRIVPEGAGIDPLDPGGAVWSSGVVPSALARYARVTTSLSNGATYRAYVRSTSTAGLASAWAYSPFTIEITPPLGPLIELSDEVDIDTGVPRVRLDILGRSSLLTDEQDSGVSGWVNDTNTTVAYQPADIPNQIFTGLLLTSQAAGLMGIVTDVGTPPLAPYGMAQEPGPLNFPVVPGIFYSAAASIRVAPGGTSRSARIRIRWYDADDGTGNLISESVGEQESVHNIFYNQVEITATAPPTAALGRMVVEILGPTAAAEQFYLSFPSFHPGQHQGWQPGGYSDTQVVRVQRSDDGGSTWNDVIERVKPSLHQVAVARDRLMPLGKDVMYRAYTEVDSGDGALLTSQVSPTAVINVDTPAWTIRDPSDDDAEILAYVIDHKRSDDEASSVHRPAGREYPIVDTEGIHSAEGSLSIFVRQSDLTAALTVLRRVTPFVVQSPIGEVFTARFLRRNYVVNAQRHRVIEVAYVEIG